MTRRQEKFQICHPFKAILCASVIPVYMNILHLKSYDYKSNILHKSCTYFSDFQSIWSSSPSSIKEAKLQFGPIP